VAECLKATNMPNAYFFTKRMAEVLISARHSVAFPVAIVRPSLVGCTARSPHPGYFGNNAGPTSIALAFALGIATFTSHKVALYIFLPTNSRLYILATLLID
jgi:fatty acyl-CoA reductase